MKSKYMSVFSAIILWGGLAIAGDFEDEGKEEAVPQPLRLSVQEIENVVNERGHERAMADHGINESRLFPIIVWGKHIESFFYTSILF